eukprot:TRINITY_DN14447_c0_g1_i1.p1 TRINITY_DN14447_c0_g1~~TRINITY_DN14447_c0_g1_i1.p1  ORF type:complete len:446 (-),score=66.06 TRINITY_DN14447_c0_g1_i1:302-1501(-)
MELETQKRFAHGFMIMFLAVVLKHLGIVKTADAPSISKVTFNLIFPALLFSGVAAIDLSPELVWVAATSTLFHATIVLVVYVLCKRCTTEDGMRGQWMFTLQGYNGGLAYPFLLASEGLRHTVFPRFVAWDLAGNSMICFGINLVIAMSFAPAKSIADDDSPSAPASPSGDAMLASVDKVSDGSSARPSQDIEKNGDCSPSPTPQSVGMHQIEDALAMEGGGGTESRFTKRYGGKLSLSQDTQRRLDVAKTATKAIMKNLPLVAQLLGLSLKLMGVAVPRYALDFLEAVGQPFALLLFFLIGLKVEWALIKPHVYTAGRMLLSKYALYGIVGGLFSLSPTLKDTLSQQMLLFACCCPVGGITMSYALDYGYRSSLQAALLVTSNIVSFMILWALVSTYG